MNRTTHDVTDGNVGLGVLLLMIIAFVAGEAQSDWQTGEASSLDNPAALESHLLIDLSQPKEKNGIGGAIRELSVVPLSIESRLDFGWTPDEAVIEEYRRSGL